MPPADAASDCLNSWKEIASYLGRQVRTVQRWEKEEGLPVHRLPHKKQGSVFAYKAELDAWRARCPALVEEAVEPAEAAPPRADAAWARRRWRWLAAAGLLLVGFAGVWAARRPSPAAPAAERLGRLFARATSQGAVPLLVPVGRGPDQVVLSPDGATAYVADLNDASISVVGLEQRRVRATWKLTGAPHSIALAPDGRALYVADDVHNDILVVDTSNGSRRTVGTPGTVSDMALSPDGTMLYLALQYNGLEGLNTRTLALHHLTGPDCPTLLALSPGGQQLFVAYQCGSLGGRSGHDAIGILDVPSGRIAGRLVGPPQVGSYLGVSHDGTELWANMGDACAAGEYDHLGCASVPSGGVNVFSVGDRSLIRTLSYSGHASAGRISFFPDNTRALVGGDRVNVFDTARLSVVEALPMFSSGKVAFAADGLHAYLPLSNRNALAILSISPQGCEPPDAGLEGWWPGDGSADDAAGLDNGRLAGGATFAPGRVGQAFALHAAGAAVVIPHSPRVGIQPAGLGAALWLEGSAEGAGAAPLLGKVAERDGRQTGWQLERWGDGRLLFCVGGGGADGCQPGRATALASPQPLPAAGWHHVAFSLAPSGAAALYLDGAVVAHARLNATHLTPDPAELVLGAGGGHAAWFQGLLDEVTLYGSPLTPAVVRQLDAMPGCLGIP